MANRPLRSLTAALLLGWTLFLSIHSSLALAETLHHHDGSEACAQAQLIDKWLQVAPAIPLEVTATQPASSQNPPGFYQFLIPAFETVGNRDPPLFQLP